MSQVDCALTSGQRQSWGRKKRSANSIDMFETARYRIPRYTHATTSVIVIDPLQQVNSGSLSC